MDGQAGDSISEEEVSVTGGLSTGAHDSLKKLLFAEPLDLLEMLDWDGLFEALSVNLVDEVGMVEGQPKKKDSLHGV